MIDQVMHGMVTADITGQQRHLAGLSRHETGRTGVCVASHRRVTRNAMDRTKTDRTMHRREIIHDIHAMGMFAMLQWVLPVEARSVEGNLELPRDYVNTVHDLIDALRDSIEVDLSGASEVEIRRKAEPAKDAVKKFINRWSDAALVKDETSCQEIRVALQELGEFYQSNGQRTRLTERVAASILAHLDKADATLPERAPKKMFPF